MPVSELQLSALNQLGEFWSLGDLNQVIADINRKFVRVSTVVNSSATHKANLALDAVIDPVIQVGQPVYWNTSSNRFELSMLEVASGSGGRLYATDRCECWGLVVRICSAGRADVLLSGLYTVDLTASTGDPSPSGKHYLSDVAGELVTTPSHSLIAPVLLATGSGEVLFRPWFADTFPRYMPSMVEIQKQPCGNIVIVGGKAVMNGANAATLGWLPAGHFAFNNTAPVGAKFGYNIAADAELSKSWPPVNPLAAKLYLEAGGTASKGSRVLLGGDTERLLINDDGIWWMTDNATQVPWNISVDGQATGTNPLAITQKLVLEADLLVYSDNTLTGVSSLTSTVDWLRITKAGSSNAARVGDLSISLDSTKLMSTDVRFGDVVLGPPVNGQFPKLYAVSGLKAGNAAVSLSGNKVGSLYVGEVEVSVVAARDVDLFPVDTQLNGATTESYANLLALGLPPGCDTYYVQSFHVPESVPADSQLIFDLWISSQLQLTLPAGLTLQATVFPKPTGSPLALATLPTASPLVLSYTPGAIVPSGQYCSLKSAQLTVAGGNTVYLKVSRSGSTDGVSAEVHILKTVGRFVTGS